MFFNPACLEESGRDLQGDNKGGAVNSASPVLPTLAPTCFCLTDCLRLGPCMQHLTFFTSPVSLQLVQQLHPVIYVSPSMNLWIS